MAGIYKRGATYWGRAQRDGREYRFSLRTPNKGIAEKRLRDWLTDMDAVAWGDKPPRPWQAVWERFMREHFPTIKPSSATRYAVSLQNLSRVMDGKNIQQVSTGLLSEFETMRRTEGASAPTIRRDLACLSCLMSYCEEWEWIEDGKNIVPAYMRRRRRKGLKEAPGGTRYLSVAEEAALIAEASEPARTAIILSIDSGLRDQEVMKLKWEQIDFANGTIKLSAERTKSKRDRFAPLPERSADLLKKRPRHFTSPFVFYHADGRPYLRMLKAFMTALKRAGIKDVRWHDLRRTAGCRWLQSGVSMERVSVMLGHASVSTTERCYAFLNPETVARTQAAQKRAQ